MVSRHPRGSRGPFSRREMMHSAAREPRRLSLSAFDIRRLLHAPEARRCRETPGKFRAQERALNPTGLAGRPVHASGGRWPMPCPDSGLDGRSAPIPGRLAIESTDRREAAVIGRVEAKWYRWKDMPKED